MPRRLSVRDRLLAICRKGGTYSPRHLAGRLGCSLSAVHYAARHSPELSEWRAKVRLPRGVRRKWPRIQDRLLDLCRGGEPYPGRRPLAHRLRCSRDTVARAMSASSELADWQARAGLLSRSKLKWPVVQHNLLAECRAGAPYTSQQRLAEAQGCDGSLVAHAIAESAELQSWKRAARGAGPVPQTQDEVIESLRQLMDRGIPYPGVMPLVRELRCPYKKISGAMRDSSHLRTWRADARLRQPRPHPKRNLARAFMEDLLARKEPYPGMAALAGQVGVSTQPVRAAIDESPKLKAWQKGSKYVSGGRRPWVRPRVQRRLDEMRRAGRPYPGGRHLSKHLACSRKLIYDVINASRQLKDWQLGLRQPPASDASRPAGTLDERVREAFALLAAKKSNRLPSCRSIAGKAQVSVSGVRKTNFWKRYMDARREARAEGRSLSPLALTDRLHKVIPAKTDEPVDQLIRQQQEDDRALGLPDVDVPDAVRRRS